MKPSPKAQVSDSSKPGLGTKFCASQRSCATNPRPPSSKPRPVTGHLRFITRAIIVRRSYRPEASFRSSSASNNALSVAGSVKASWGVLPGAAARCGSAIPLQGFCFVYLFQWVRWDMEQQALGVSAPGAISFGPCGRVIVERERERERERESRVHGAIAQHCRAGAATRCMLEEITNPRSHKSNVGTHRSFGAACR